MSRLQQLDPYTALDNRTTGVEKQTLIAVNNTLTAIQTLTV